ncbi:2-oxoglutarate dehydrogenase E1 component [Paenibacillus crassostreae]|uniref:2-oxoglutarate dehydrogenase E1 component n=1 Tax=Paenibacillus crassostreae TaxID=1763538 RepID=A0A167GHN7_9BACL|nr:2-oxoglutarate dehydrogenase E1 component [Paenibacillus crassostreae]AOZ92124.1 2-oxoglutarate dehydrogenase E1 component [Paenibacillus crassostreae]OAB77585.1 2-oxoglutarate dehydrogenase subunit E1 [Paenibacillus crassostreae]
MIMNKQHSSDPWQTYYGPNLGYVQEQYDLFLRNPKSVDETFQHLFSLWGAPPTVADEVSIPQKPSERISWDRNLLKKGVDAGKLVWNIRAYGHLAADIDPLGIRPDSDTSLLEPERYNLSQEDLKAFPSSLIWHHAPENVPNGWDAIVKLREIYTGTIAYEFSHVHEEEERVWLNRHAESPSNSLTLVERTALLRRLIQVEQFEEFLHRTFVGQKRFSIEGNDVLVPMLDEMVIALTDSGSKHILMGMAHRGRLNVLAHVLGKPYQNIFSEFHHSPNKKLFPSEGSTGINYGWTGDVKYHLGANRLFREGDHLQARITLANNPSHLEFVNPVVEGFTRAAQEDRTQPGYPLQDVNKASTILIHGDAAFPGEGIVAETLNFTKLPGYQNGGTIHIIVNNNLGFTTESKDSRSTHYASDLAKGYEIPIVHVNADDPEACIAAVRMACAYRDRFKKDFLIDLVGYRRYGHNETDDPDTTQPLIYQKIRKHERVSAIYSSNLSKAGLVLKEQAEQLKESVLNRLNEAYDQMKRDDVRNATQQSIAVLVPEGIENVCTAVPLAQLKEINEGLLKRPDGFKVYPKLQRILERRTNSLAEGEKVDWGLAETLSFATIIADGKPIRISGQDVERATFAHRNLVLHDSESGATYCPIHELPQAKASFAIHNSPLSEASVLGFEYGYNVFSPETLVIWEAQYGDFSNCAQVIMDQFISAGRSKWTQRSSLVMLLPHGYEGQGPEHSSARLERFLQLAGDDNWTVANLTSSSQYFHLLRRQAALTETDEARPLVIMSPKSLIRNARVASPAQEFSNGTFHPILEQSGLGVNPERVERLILCTGKIAVELEEALDNETEKRPEWLHIIRVEQLYPFPEEQIKQVIDRLSILKEIVWVQEEPQNMGAWRYIEPRIRATVQEKIPVTYNGRPERSSTASGYQKVHLFEQQQIISLALRLNQSQSN